MRIVYTRGTQEIIKLDITELKIMLLLTQCGHVYLHIN